MTYPFFELGNWWDSTFILKRIVAKFKVSGLFEETLNLSICFFIRRWTNMKATHISLLPQNFQKTNYSTNRYFTKPNHHLDVMFTGSVSKRRGTVYDPHLKQPEMLILPWHSGLRNQARGCSNGLKFSLGGKTYFHKSENLFERHYGVTSAVNYHITRIHAPSGPSH